MYQVTKRDGEITEFNRVGFNDPKYFTRCFTKQFGISPTAYKDQLDSLPEKN